MIAYPNAKINLGLNILRKRNDGFHAIESVFVPIPWQDILEIIEDVNGQPGQVTFTSTGIDVPVDGKPNLCQRAYQLLHGQHPLPAVLMHLHKQIPIGAGLGGGSADGAFALRMLNDIFHLEKSDSELEKLAATLGSDCPFFIQNTPKFVSGRGEVMNDTAVSLAGHHLVLIYPNIHISTAEAYAGVRPAIAAPTVSAVLSRPMQHWKDALHNDFETSLFPKHPILPAIKEQLYAHGAIYASMTGSGSAMYGIFTDQVRMPEMKDVMTKWIKM